MMYEGVPPNDPLQVDRKAQNTMNNDNSDANGIPPARQVGRKRSIDESSLTPEEKLKLERRRAYNRQSAQQGT